MNYFEVFGLPRKLAIDAAALQRRFYELSRQHHPDFHQAAPADAQARALETSARVNAAYRALRDPIARVEYLVRLEEGRETQRRGHASSRRRRPSCSKRCSRSRKPCRRRGRAVSTTRRAPPSTTQRERLGARRADEEDRSPAELSAAWDAAAPAERPKVLAAFKEALATRAYLRTVIDDLGRRARRRGPGDGHVAHHRH